MHRCSQKFTDPSASRNMNEQRNCASFVSNVRVTFVELRAENSPVPGFLATFSPTEMNLGDAV
jgi:hypothetical protein